VLIFACCQLFLCYYTNEKKDDMVWPAHSQINMKQLLCYLSYMGVYRNTRWYVYKLQSPSTCNTLICLFT
jgi:hypothetical protein